jgi:L-alanine-DL-glutamate epimerase-like enolase superfamily enzyme
MFGGFTEGRKMAALCELNHVQVTPHHDCFIHAQLAASTPAGCFVEAFTDPERDPLQAELFENPPKIEDGWLTLDDAPGPKPTIENDTLRVVFHKQANGPCERALRKLT